MTTMDIQEIVKSFWTQIKAQSIRIDRVETKTNIAIALSLLAIISVLISITL